MLITLSNRKYVAVTIGLVLLAVSAGTATASCDVEKVCKYVEKEKNKARKKASEAADKITTEQTSEAESTEQSPETATTEQSPAIENDSQLLEDAQAKILHQCNYEMDATERVCKLEDVIRHCWYEDKDALEYCKE